MDSNFYIVSFGESNKFKVAKDNYGLIEKAQKFLESALHKEFLGQSIANFIKPEIKEISATEIDKYKDYKTLDKSSFESILKTLTNGINVKDALQKLDLNAPFSFL